MGIKKKQKKSVDPTPPNPPQLAKRRSHHQSTYQMGRTISEKREVLEKRSEREAARKEDKRRESLRVLFTFLGFAILIAALIFLLFFFVGSGEPEAPAEIDPEEVTVVTEPTVEIVDEDATAGGQITSRMRSYIGQAEQDFRDLGLTPVKVVIPAGTIREVDFYIDGKPGYVRMTIDRDSAVSVEDADRMYRYLAASGIADYSYIDVRVKGKAYWK